MTLTISFRVDARTPSHVRTTVFVNHGNCGQLTLRVEEFDALRQLLQFVDEPTVCPDCGEVTCDPDCPRGRPS